MSWMKSGSALSGQSVGLPRSNKLGSFAACAGVILGVAWVVGSAVMSETAQAQSIPGGILQSGGQGAKPAAEEAAKKEREKEQEKTLTAEREKARQAAAAERARRLKAEDDADQATKDKAAAEARASKAESELRLLKQQQSTPQPPRQQQPATATAPVAPAPVPPPSPAPTQVTTRQAFEPEMVAIPAGDFTMGSIDGNFDEGPTRRVTVRSFEMGKYEVTQGQWKAVMGSTLSSFKNCGDNCPVEQVSWDDIQQFIQKLNQQTGKQYRLPSEAEYEYAARAGCTTDFNVDGQCRVKIEASEANFDGNYTYKGSAKGVYRIKTVKVGSFQPNTFGLHDMHGNALEWVQDCFEDDYSKGQPSDGSAHRGNDSSCSLRVLRGGSFFDDPGSLRSGYRNRASPGYRNSSIGFRIVRTLP